MAAVAAVSIDDDLAAGESAVAVRSADDEAAGGVDVVDRRAGQVLFGNGLLDQFLDDRLADLFVFGVGRMLRRDDDRVDFDRAAIDVAHGDLALGVGPQKIELPGLAEPGEIFHQPMRHRDRQRHDFRRLVAGEPEHQALVAGALFLVEAFTFGDTLGDIGRLRLDRGQHGATVAVETDLGAVVTDLDCGLPRNLHVVGARAAGYLAGQHDQARSWPATRARPASRGPRQ